MFFLSKEKIAFTFVTCNINDTLPYTLYQFTAFMCIAAMIAVQ